MGNSASNGKGDSNLGLFFNENTSYFLLGFLGVKKKEKRHSVFTFLFFVRREYSSSMFFLF
jgi:hypothetical protein